MLCHIIPKHQASGSFIIIIALLKFSNSKDKHKFRKKKQSAIYILKHNYLMLVPNKTRHCRIPSIQCFNDVGE